MKILILIAVLATAVARPAHGPGTVPGSIRHEITGGTVGLYDPNTPWWPAPQRHP